MTFKDMYEKIVESGIFPGLSAEEIYNYSPTGKLGMIPAWYNEARFKLGEITEKEYRFFK